MTSYFKYIAESLATGGECTSVGVILKDEREEAVNKPEIFNSGFLDYSAAFNFPVELLNVDTDYALCDVGCGSGQAAQETARILRLRNVVGINLTDLRATSAIAVSIPYITGFAEQLFKRKNMKSMRREARGALPADMVLMKNSLWQSCMARGTGRDLLKGVYEEGLKAGGKILICEDQSSPELERILYDHYISLAVQLGYAYEVLPCITQGKSYIRITKPL